MAYGVVRTDKMFGTRNRAGLVSVLYLGEDGQTESEIENGSIVYVGDLYDEEQEVFVGTEVPFGASIDRVVLIATPEVMYDERKRNLSDFINKAGMICRGYRFHDGDIFSITKNMFTGVQSPSIGDIVEIVGGTKLNIEQIASAGSTVIGEIIGIDVVGNYTYYVVGVNSLVDEDPHGGSDDSLVGSAIVGYAVVGSDETSGG